MPYFAYLRHDELAAFLFLTIFIAVSVLLGFTALGIAWGGRRMGMLFAAFGLASSLLSLGIVWRIAPHLWWIAVVPIAMGATAVRAWYSHRGPAEARLLRFDLRGLLTVVLLICLILGGITSQYRQRRIEEEATATLQALSQTGQTDIRWNFGRVTDVIMFSLRDPADFDQAADALERFSQLHFLQINDPLPGSVTQRLGGLTTLRTLIAQGIPVTDDDLVPLATLGNLETLDLDARQLTDAGLPNLLKLQQLRLLHLYNANQVTPAAMKSLRAKLPHLDNP